MTKKAWDLKDFIKWLKTRPADETYDYTEPTKCAIAQYRNARGIQPVALKSGEIPHPFYMIVHPPYRSEPWTFGAALKRARAALNYAARGEKP
jgi:hypothetical protein